MRRVICSGLDSPDDRSREGEQGRGTGKGSREGEQGRGVEFLAAGLVEVLSGVRVEILIEILIEMLNLSYHPAFAPPPWIKTPHLLACPRPAARLTYTGTRRSWCSGRRVHRSFSCVHK